MQCFFSSGNLALYFVKKVRFPAHHLLLTNPHCPLTLCLSTTQSVVFIFVLKISWESELSRLTYKFMASYFLPFQKPKPTEFSIFQCSKFTYSSRFSTDHWQFFGELTNMPLHQFFNPIDITTSNIPKYLSKLFICIFEFEILPSYHGHSDR